ncbi:hypothetical protein ACFL2Q_09795 [Thermodesulfobacteriota bacterium]
MESDVRSPVVSGGTFVTAIAWIFIVFYGFALFVSIIQNFVLNFVFPETFLNQPFHSPEMGARLPGIYVFIFSNMRLLFLAMLVPLVATVVASVGLLKRLKWARVLFIAMLGFYMAAAVVAVIAQNTALSTMAVGMDSQETGDLLGPYHSAILAIRIGGVAIALAYCGILGWIIAKLSSKKIRAEFIH